MFSTKKNLPNVISVLVYCAQDNTFLLLLDEVRGDYWIPSMEMNGKYSWKDNLQFFKKKLFDYEVLNEKLLKIFKIWTLKKEYFHLMFQVTLPKEVKTHCKTQTDLGKTGWYNCAQIAKLKPYLRSLEILEVTHNYTPKVFREVEKVSGEMIPMGSLTEVREADILVTPDTFHDRIHLDLLESAGIPVEEQYTLYEEFFMYTYPCIYMNPVSFRNSMSKFTFFGDYDSLFKAADVWKRDFLTFQDYLFLVAVMEPCTAHYGNLAECRCQYIFRYYDENRDGKLDYHDFQSMITDIYRLKNATADKTEIDKQIQSVSKAIGFKAGSHMTFDQFYTYVVMSKISDTSILLRVVQNHIGGSGSEMSVGALSRGVLPRKIVLPTISTLGEPMDDYTLVLKTTLLKPGDNPLEVKEFRFLEDAVTKSVYEDYEMFNNLKLRRMDSFDLELRTNELLLALRYFCTEICQSPVLCGEFEFEEKDAYNWGSAYLERLGITLIMMCEQLKDILSNEPRLLEIDSPVFIMGDLHGNFHDLMCFEKTLWTNGVALTPAKLLFLGDYVDRGPNSLEVVMYLFANKLQNVEKLYLIRGNHEIRDIQKLFTFHRECNFKLGPSLGTSVWKAVNEVFDVMPLAATIDKKVFCCHGGIPPPWLCPTISVINTIPCPLVNCERQSPLAWTLMWNDPLKNAFRNSIQELELVANEGFIPNVQRGTGYVFSCEALDRFLKINNLSQVIRAHEVVKSGFQVHQKGRLLTVFSSSGYCGGKNYAASVLVAEKRLRVFMVDTGIS